MEKFEDFIKLSNLLEIKMIGKKFTCYRPDGTCKSKLDRLLINEEWGNTWPSQILKGGSQTLSDHRPIFIQEVSKDWGPKPFKLFNWWLQQQSFVNLVESKWRGNVFNGWNAFKLKEKLKALKLDIKEWSKTHVGKLESDIANMKEEIDQLDPIDDTLGLDEEEAESRFNLQQQLASFMNRKEAELIQRAKIKWAKDRDMNSGMFHRMINQRVRRNGIEGIRVEGRWVERVQDVKSTVFNFFKSHFQEGMCNRPTIPQNLFSRLNLVNQEEGQSTVCTNLKTFELIWKCFAPRKAVTLTWRLLHDLLPTKTNLIRRCIIPPSDSRCPLCLDKEETAQHLFFHCRVSSRLWGDIYDWSSISTAARLAPADHCVQHAFLLPGDIKGTLGLSLWIGVIWNLWILRNDIVFNNSILNIDRVLSNVKISLWTWMKAKGMIDFNCNFSS
ncbi:hypothetical protein ACS0TY_023235 [Phlomoides rotata]